MAIQDEATYREAIKTLTSLPIAKLGVRKKWQTSRSTMKPANTAALFMYGGPYELHVSRTTGQMEDHVWCYYRGVACHETVDPETCRIVIDLADKIIAARAEA
jgi:hypothetical protein